MNMNKIVTVTLNPAIDMTVGLDVLVPGDVHRATGVGHNAGGKGVNVAACLADWGVPVTATGFLGEDNPGLFQALFASKHVEDAFLRIPGRTRYNIKLTEPGGRTTDINLPGQQISDAMLEAVQTQLGHLNPDILVLAGSLPQGVPATIWADLSARWRARGTKVFVDASGAPLVQVFARADALPYAIKPNRAELSAAAGRVLDNAGLLAEAKSLLARGIALVVVSMGEGGAVFLSADGALYARADRVDAISSVGAGDAMVAGIVAALSEGAALERIARLATAFAAAKLHRVGPNLPPRSEVETLAAQVQIENADVWVHKNTAAEAVA